MQQLSDLFRALYQQFLLPDVFGKVLPGLIVLVPFQLGAVSSTGELTEVYSVSLQTSLPGWSLVGILGLAWGRTCCTSPR